MCLSLVPGSTAIDRRDSDEPRVVACHSRTDDHVVMGVRGAEVNEHDETLIQFVIGRQEIKEVSASSMCCTQRVDPSIALDLDGRRTVSHARPNNTVSESFDQTLDEGSYSPCAQSHGCSMFRRGLVGGATRGRASTAACV